jgi:hypothetical protein
MILHYHSYFKQCKYEIILNKAVTHRADKPGLNMRKFLKIPISYHNESEQMVTEQQTDRKNTDHVDCHNGNPIHNQQAIMMMVIK